MFLVRSGSKEMPLEHMSWMTKIMCVQVEEMIMKLLI